MKNISKILNIRAFIYAFLIWINLNISGIQNIYFSEGNISTIIMEDPVYHEDDFSEGLYETTLSEDDE